MQARSIRFLPLSAASADTLPARAPEPTSRLAGKRLHPLVLPFLFLVTTLLTVLPAPAQPTFRDLAGVVFDRDHEPLRGAVVQVHNEATKGVLSFITGRDGAYSFKRLDGATDYQVWATYRGHRSHTRKLSLFDSNRPKNLNLTIRVQ